MALLRYTSSTQSLAQARKVTPGGAQTLSKMAERFPEGAFPAVAMTGFGNYLYDVDQNRYLDYICGLGAVTLGYDNPVVTRWARQYIGAPTLSLPSTLERRLAERLIELIPCAEMVRFTKTGSEAAEAAIRIARAETGRDVILTCGYHSWHSWYAASKESHIGVPESMRELVSPFRYNDVDNFREALDCHDADVAAVIIEPTLIEPPDPGFLETVAEETRRLGAVLIFDEMVTGFRWATGGYQTICEITPDLAIFGKGMANGFPLACVVGSRSLMENWGKLASGTFGGETVSLAAAMGVLDVYEIQDICGNMFSKGAALKGIFGDLLEGQPFHPRWVFKGEQMALFLQETARRGLLFHPSGFNIPGLLTEKEWEFTVDMVRESLIAMGAEKLQGQPLREHPFRTAQ